MPFVDFASIKQDYPIQEVATALGLELEERNGQLRGKCPSGEGDERGLVITPSKGLFFSFPQSKGGDCISLVSFVKDMSTKDSARWIVETLGGSSATTEENTEQGKGAGLKELDYLQHDHPAVESLGFESSDAKLFGIGYAPKGIMRGMVAVPIRIADGTLVGYIGITEARLPKSWKW